MNDLPARCPICDSATDPARDCCACGHASCYACGELLVEPAGEAQS